MRIVDFIMILPTLMIIIVFIAVIQTTQCSLCINHDGLLLVSFCSFIQTHSSKLDYVNASKTLGSSDLSSWGIVSNLTFSRKHWYWNRVAYLSFGFITTPSQYINLCSKNADVKINYGFWLPANLIFCDDGMYQLCWSSLTTCSGFSPTFRLINKLQRGEGNFSLFCAEKAK